jgi:hypothetical protein
MKKYLQLVLVGILAVSLYACRDYLELSITDGDVRIVAELSQPSSLPDPRQPSPRVSTDQTDGKSPLTFLPLLDLSQFSVLL